MTTAEVIPLGTRTLEELAVAASQGHQRVLKSVGSALASAIDVGDILLEARAMIGNRTEWLEWAETNAQLAHTAADRYSRLAYYKHKLPKELLEPREFATVGQAQTRPGLMLAYEYLRGLPSINGKRGHSRTFDYEEAKRLHRSGVPKKEIARLMGVSSNVLRRSLLTPEQRRRMDARKSRMKEARARERARVEIAKLKAPSDLSEAYSLVRRALQIMQAVQDRGPQGVRGRSGPASFAIAGLHNAEDAIIRAIKDGVINE